MMNEQINHDGRPIEKSTADGGNHNGGGGMDLNANIQAGVKGERLIVAAHHGLRRRGY
jgi:hypothetical protein